jgi:short subunit dehydrogenase-like uncharacterized protein
MKEYLVENYSNEVKIALAGRNQKRLEAVRDTLTKVHPQAKNLPILIGDSADLASLLAITKQTKCVATTVGEHMSHLSPHPYRHFIPLPA